MKKGFAGEPGETFSPNSLDGYLTVPQVPTCCSGLRQGTVSYRGDFLAACVADLACLLIKQASGLEPIRHFRQGNDRLHANRQFGVRVGLFSGPD